MIVDDYAKVQGILTGTVAAFVVFTIGPECVSSNLCFLRLSCSMHFPPLGTTARTLKNTRLRRRKAPRTMMRRWTSWEYIM